MKKPHAFALTGALALGFCALPFASVHATAAQDAATSTAPTTASIDGEVRRIEQALPTLKRKEVTLQPAALAGITETKWARLHAYGNDGQVERLKLYPPQGSAKTEEFYYQAGKLIHVFIEPNGAGHEGHDASAKGTRYYFNAGGLFAVGTDGATPNTRLDASQQAMGAKLVRESAALLALGAK